MQGPAGGRPFSANVHLHECFLRDRILVGETVRSDAISYVRSVATFYNYASILKKSRWGYNYDIIQFPPSLSHAARSLPQVFM